MDFGDRLAAWRKQRGWTQAQLAEALGLNLTQIKRYETGASQPSLDALRTIALTLNVSLDELVFGDTERGPDEALKLKFEAIRQFDEHERAIAEGVLDSLIVQHQAKRLFGRTAEPTANKQSRSGKRISESTSSR
ncbi:helix-turn-helix domain-containing protein [Pseudoxanthomonas sp. CAU 1598]|uniref:Helix-turn-helix domain-containing protein n=2 Tax=Pseudomarimonas arenosa TaxID=2774145 RepID=A0AAW3ZPR8_9GAMM|nr:helix-turn-helix domain-containing protein [Pseudomarimonas arenosa]